MGHRILKVHVFFWLSEPALDQHIKAVLVEHAPDVDDAPFVANQILYTADSIILGAPDPIPQRIGWKDGLIPSAQCVDRFRPPPSQAILGQQV